MSAMFLVNTSTYKLEYFDDETKVPGGYAILSHVWEKDALGKSIETLYKDISNPQSEEITQPGKQWFKIKRSCVQARTEQTPLTYIWVDTCCIDKSSSADLQEAINSMFRWYSSAAVCYAYLNDVDWTHEESTKLSNDTAFVKSKWFTRGWTLQELLAPQNMRFYDKNWKLIGRRQDMLNQIIEATNIPEMFVKNGLLDSKSFKPCAADIMFWASRRETTRVEDRAYSLLGLLGVYMPLLYGEGDNALMRLQYEVLNSSGDQSLFAWSDDPPSNTDSMLYNAGLLTKSLQSFVEIRSTFGLIRGMYRRKGHVVSSEGITAEFELLSLAPRVYIALLNPRIEEYNLPLNMEGQTSNLSDLMNRGRTPEFRRIGILVKRIDREGRYVRVPRATAKLLYGWPDLTTFRQGSYIGEREKRQVTVVKELRGKEVRLLQELDYCGFRVRGHGEWADFAPEVTHNSYLCTDKTIHLKPQTDNWLATHEAKIVGIQGRTPSYGLVGIFWRMSQSKCVGWTKDYRNLRFHLCYIGFGFDFDYRPTCVLAMNADASLNLERDQITHVDHAMILTSFFQNHRSINNRIINTQKSFSDDEDIYHNINGGPQNIDDKLFIELNNGRWQNFKDGYLMIKANIWGRDEGLAVDAGIGLRAEYPKVLLRISIWRANDQDPWDVSVV